MLSHDRVEHSSPLLSLVCDPHTVRARACSPFTRGSVQVPRSTAPGRVMGWPRRVEGLGEGRAVGGAWAWPGWVHSRSLSRVVSACRGAQGGFWCRWGQVRLAFYSKVGRSRRSTGRWASEGAQRRRGRPKGLQGLAGLISVSPEEADGVWGRELSNISPPEMEVNLEGNFGVWSSGICCAYWHPCAYVEAAAGTRSLDLGNPQGMALKVVPGAGQHQPPDHRKILL